ncbi:hypothetical protein [Bacillus swezeyi]|uniref:hypothetical protein n=1 Tax=Bacillus swezeyi TaxID=1925020 RepID=UPI003F8B439E
MWIINFNNHELKIIYLFCVREKETGYIKRHVSLTIQRYAEQYPHFQNQYQRLQILDTLDSSHNFFVSFRFDGLTQNEGTSGIFRDQSSAMLKLGRSAQSGCTQPYFLLFFQMMQWRPPLL